MFMAWECGFLGGHGNSLRCVGHVGLLITAIKSSHHAGQSILGPIVALAIVVRSIVVGLMSWQLRT